MDTSSGPVVVGINVGTYVLSRIERESSENGPQVSQEVIANTAVSAHAFSSLVARFRSVPLLQSEDDVRELQLHLQALRHYMGPIDGSYGPLLKAAIEEFERAHGLPVTGFATNDLLGLLASDAEFLNRSAMRTIGRSRPALHTGATGQTRQ
jgi:protease YdgD